MDKLSQWQAASNITTSIYTRRTVEGRKLTYRLHVLQQPERARACGNGAKASADRRPVDPPPVVELRVFQGEGSNFNELEDITTAYHNVNFFLFATLEARPIASGRVHAPGPPSVPVLNGCNVAGINYLERPQPAGYFIFPDLSVRHEGMYRLNFALYEQVKDARDADPDRPFPPPGHEKAEAMTGPPQAHNASIQRLDVKSEEFQVYSAKKFPGLDRSTGLSIGLSDQGCRVRIRRDVRMRKRPKPKPINEQYGDDSHSGRYATQGEGLPLSHDRHRSLSHGSRDGSQYGERRLSIQTGDLYGHHQPAPVPLVSAAPITGSGFAVPNTSPSSLPSSAPYHHHHYATQAALPSPIAPPGRSHDYAPNPEQYRAYDHRISNASSGYPPSDVGSRRPSEIAGHSKAETSSYRRPTESTTYRPTEPPSYHPSEPPYHRQPSDASRYAPAHYSYASSGNKITIASEQPMLPPVNDLIRESDLRQADLQAGKRRMNSPPAGNTQSLKGGMRPSGHEAYDDSYPPPGLLEYKRAHGGVARTPMDSRRY